MQSSQPAKVETIVALFPGNCAIGFFFLFGIVDEFPSTEQILFFFTVTV